MFVRVQVPPAVLFRREDIEIEDAGRCPFLFCGSTNKSIQINFFSCPCRANLNIRLFSSGRCLGLDNGLPLLGGRVDLTGLGSLIRIDSSNVSPGRILLECEEMPLQADWHIYWPHTSYSQL